MKRHILSILIISCWLLAACSSSDNPGEEQHAHEPAVLTVYVYSPDNPVMTRADIGEVNASEEENKVNLLQIWVYDHSDNKLIAYLGTTETASLNAGEGSIYQIPVDEEFAGKPQAERYVDVYVLANASDNCGISTTALTSGLSLQDLSDRAKIDQSHFGLSSLTTAVPSGGLPMEGQLINQPVIGEAPVLRVGTQSNIATVPLTRAVSKMQFVFANMHIGDNTPKLTINNIHMDAGIIPNEEYLIPQSKVLTYNTSVASLLSSPINDVVAVEDPSLYVFQDGEETAQQYEDRINAAIATGQLAIPASAYYLRESDKQLSGTISYSVDDVPMPDVPFTMSMAGDFSRNHTWIVYAYYEAFVLELVVVSINNWKDKPADDHAVYNW